MTNVLDDEVSPKNATTSAIDARSEAVALDGLTVAILGHVADGRTIAQAATAAGVSVWRARERVRHARLAWNCPKTIQVVVRAVRLGLL